MKNTTTASAPIATTHTPGPWTIKPIAYIFNNPCQWEIWGCNGVVAETNSKTNDSDARLIAAAPDMVDALRWAESCFFPLIHSNSSDEREHAFKDAAHALECIRAALAKAEGAQT
jgi:hypothetical protein